MQQMLLRLVGRKQHCTLLGERVLTPRLDEKESLQSEKSGPGAATFLIVQPLEVLLHGLRHAPAVGKAKLGEHRTRRGEAEVLNQVLAQESHGDGIEQEGALPGEADHPSLWVDKMRQRVFRSQ